MVSVSLPAGVSQYLPTQTTVHTVTVCTLDEV